MTDDKYELIWPGKSDAAGLAKTKTISELRLIKEKSRNINTTENRIIEGDNLEALKHLRENNEKVDLIYIDPPYNTGNDFTYNDDFGHHANWLNMMMPRLIVTKDIMAEDGLLFISIDDKELANLKILCNEIFGEKNFIALFIIDKTAQGANAGRQFKIRHEYCLLYKKSDNPALNNKIDIPPDPRKYKYKDDFGEYAITNAFDSINSPLARNKKRGYTIYYKNIDDIIIKDEYNADTATF